MEGCGSCLIGLPIVVVVSTTIGVQYIHDEMELRCSKKKRSACNNKNLRVFTTIENAFLPMRVLFYLLIINLVFQKKKEWGGSRGVLITFLSIVKNTQKARLLLRVCSAMYTYVRCAHIPLYERYE